MKILGIDSSGMVASVALIEDGTIKAEYTINNKKTHSTTLLPMLDEMSRLLEDDMSDVDAIAVAAGPGSFTGLRIGSASVKALAMSFNAPVVEVPTVDALAYNLWGSDCVICPLMDARRNQTYTGLYEFIKEKDTYRLHTLKEQCAVPIEEILEEIDRLDRKVIFLGDGVPVFKGIIDSSVRSKYAYAPATCNRQKASSVAMLGGLLFEEGKTVTATEHTPEYLRMSQAERERMEQQNADS